MCRVPKLFRLSSKLGRIVQDMKLNKTKVRYILRQNRKKVPQKRLHGMSRSHKGEFSRSLKNTRIPGKSLSLAKKLVAPANPSLRKRQRSSEQPMLATALERACWRLRSGNNLRLLAIWYG